MYSTCIFCHAALGRNEAIEAFPVGRRLAFDAAKGRLWVVCAKCARWNLTPLDARWEAVEECERQFAASKLRISTDQIGLARVREGTTLVRVGNPLRPEMATWRYGERFQRRRTKHLALGAATILGVGAVALGGPLAGMLTWSGAASLAYNGRHLIRDFRPALKLPVAGSVVKLNRMHLSMVRIRPNEGQGFVLEILHRHTGTFRERWKQFGLTLEDKARQTVCGAEAVRAARHLLPRINRAGGTANDVVGAVAELERGEDVDAMFSRAAWTPHKSLPWRDQPVRKKMTGPFMLLASLPAPVRLALEMAIHEDDERRAMEGELAALEERWREAEEVAAIADAMFLPQAVTDAMERLRG